MAKMSAGLPWPGNVRAGTVEDEARGRGLAPPNARGPQTCPEPLLGPIDRLDLSGIGW